MVEMEIFQQMGMSGTRLNDVRYVVCDFLAKSYKPNIAHRPTD